MQDMAFYIQVAVITLAVVLGMIVVYHVLKLVSKILKFVFNVLDYVFSKIFAVLGILLLIAMVLGGGLLILGSIITYLEDQKIELGMLATGVALLFIGILVLGIVFEKPRNQPAVSSSYSYDPYSGYDPRERTAYDTMMDEQIRDRRLAREQQENDANESRRAEEAAYDRQQAAEQASRAIQEAREADRHKRWVEQESDGMSALGAAGLIGMRPPDDFE